MLMDFFFAYTSTYSYLSVMRADSLAARAGVTLRWRPFRLRTITQEQNNRPFIGKPVKLRYMWRDVERRAKQHGIPFNGIPPYPVDAEALAHRVGIVAAGEGWCAEYSRAVYQGWFVDHKDPGDPIQLREVLARLGKDADAVISRANSPQIESQLVSETDVARSVGIFGSPTFVVGREIFWGDDRLETALEWCEAPLE
jgi:2-hydroxychromene-2-carboxylate isomerase